MARRVSNSKKKGKPRLAQKLNRQLFGFILLLLVFAILCYVTFIMFTEGTLFKDPYQPSTSTEGSNNTGMTSVSIVYKNVSKT